MAMESALSALGQGIRPPMPAPQPQGGGIQWEQLLKLLPLILAGMKGGMPAVGGYATGLAEGERQNQMLGMRRDELAYGREQDERQRQRQDAYDQRQRQQDSLAEAERMRRDQRQIFEDLQGDAGTAVESAPMADPNVDPEHWALERTQEAANRLNADPDTVQRVAAQVGPALSQRKRTSAVAILNALKGVDPQALQGRTFMDGLTLDQIKAMAGEAGAGFGLPQQSPMQLVEEMVGGRRVKTMKRLSEGESVAVPPSERAPEPLVAIMGANGEPVLVPRGQAVGQRPANTREQGRPVPASTAMQLAEISVSRKDAKTLREQLGTTGAESKLGAMVPNVVTEMTGFGADAKARQAVIDRVKQVIGKALEGGVLRKEDEMKYAKILPTIGDPPSVAAAKLDGLDRALAMRYQEQLDELESAGYDVAKFQARNAGGPPQAASKPGRKVGRFEIVEVK